MNGAAQVTGPFHIRDPLRGGLTVIEASAGTGKTYSLAGLVTRFVAERRLKASELCVVSFTEAATAELRGRIRDKLVEALHHLDTGTESSDDVIGPLVAKREQRVAYRQAVAAAVADFDLATVSTIHGFCSRVVATGGAGGLDLALTGDDSDVDEITNDRFIERFGEAGRWPAKPSKVADAVRLRLRMPDARMLRVDRGGEGRKLTTGQLARADALDAVAELVDDIVDDVLRQRAERRRRTFDSLLVEARDLLTGPRAAATRAVLQRFSLVMIDEFQDTDQVQWDIFRSAFLERPDPATVVVVGDPKQSIYRFRSAELSAYLAARREADAVLSLGTNWRSDGPVLAALDRLFAGYRFGHADVGFQRVDPAPGREATALVDPSPDAAPLQFRLLDQGSAAEANAQARHDLVGEVVRLLTEVELAHPDDPARRRRVQASDIGVLVRANADATALVAALSSAGVPAASSSNDSVLDSAAAAQWRIFLSALDRPSSAGRARAAGLSWFVGMAPHELDALDDDGLGALVERLRDWSLGLATGGLAALMAAVRASGLQQRILARAGGERDLTDLEHILELLQSSVGGRASAASALLAVLDGLADPDPTAEEQFAPELLARRIDRDDDTVKVLTVHRAKGLEFPIVLCPTLWRKRPNRSGVHHAEVDGVRLVDTNCMLVDDPSKGGDRFLVVDRADKQESLGEDSRLLYVALTRAKHRLVLWWDPCAITTNTRPPLGELLEHAGDGAIDVPALVAEAGGTMSCVDVVAAAETAVLPPVEHDGGALEVAVATRHLDRTWYQWSFSSIKARLDDLDRQRGERVAEGVAHGSDAPAVGGVDEPAEVVPPLEVLGGVAPGTPLQSAPAGTAFGTLVHSVLERVDFAAADVAEQLRERSAELLHYRRLAVTPDALADGLLGALSSPLGGCMEDRRLVDVGRGDRLDELGFDVPLARLDARAVAEVVARHAAANDPFRSWFHLVAAGGAPVDVAGLLTGSIDLVARAGHRYWLADYKTNLLPDGDYGPAALAGAMTHHGYPLQATLYLVALHRYLRWRLRGYDPDRHLAGAAYLFLRGMRPWAGAVEAPGVLWWRPPTAAVDELDRLLATGVAA